MTWNNKPRTGIAAQGRRSMFLCALCVSVVNHFFRGSSATLPHPRLNMKTLTTCKFLQYTIFFTLKFTQPPRAKGGPVGVLASDGFTHGY
jgi:hypothetical protein